MSRPLLLAAVVAFALLGLAPVVVMVARVDGADLHAILAARSAALLGRTALLGAGAALIALVVGIPFGFLVARTDVPGAPLWRIAGVLPILLPPLVVAMSWAGMTTLRGGLATTLVLGLCTFPLVALYSARAFERVDGRQEEAALLAGGLRAALRAELPLVLPSALFAACFAFVLAINDFAVPDYVSSIGPKWNVYADEIFASWRSSRDTGSAVASALPLVLLTALALWPALEMRRRSLLTSFSGDFRAPGTLRLGFWRWPALAFVLAVLGVAAFTPLGRLVWESGGGARGFSAANMQASFARALELGRANLASSLTFALGAAVIAVPLGLVLGHALERSGTLGRRLAPLVLIPIAVPAILFGIGGIALWNHAATGAIYDSGWMAVLLFAGRFLPFAVLSCAAATAMLDRRVEDSARLAGAGPARRLVRIVGPALAPAVFGSGLVVFVLSMRELDAAILVPAANSTVLFRLYNAVHFGRDDFVAALALLVVFFVVAPGLLWTLFARRRLEILP
ncbi:MAG: ABC transporter permease subunit [Planctomycetota bacterium]|nr:ABC transporter permease subunit [Planctomycetota bacterium]